MNRSKRSIDEIEITLTNHVTFYAIAHGHHEQVLKLAKERNSRPLATAADVDHNALKNAEIQRAAMVVVIFSALTLEAFINYYGIDKLSKGFFEEHLDRLSPRSKWLVLPKLIVGAEIPRGGQAYEGIVTLFRLRDKLVHYKAGKKRIRDLKEDEDWVTEEHARLGIDTAETAVHALKAVDPRVETDWVREGRTDRFV